MSDAFTVENLGDSFMVTIQQDGVSEAQNVLQTDTYQQSIDCFHDLMKNYKASELLCQKSVHNIQFMLN